eukprot:TRINITY_DN2345_c1_g1_i1.p1 TRINITY_DN2345_c1_g1~~TRINITY_DN2345_c1_g1_i1.p1  ORF type:complete len:417 (+),score=115.67 TRINITY_DN2345_c1_g1_i1:36-1253(+)
MKSRWWEYVLIPVMSAVVGYVTNIIALKMTFYPLEFFGVYQFWPGIGLGWQGIIPMKAEKMATIAVDLMTTKLINIEDIMRRLDPVMISRELAPVLNRMLEQIISEVALQESPGVWEALPSRVKDEIIHTAAEDAPAVIESMALEVRNNIMDVFDLKKMVVDSLVKDKELLNTIFLKCGAQELIFIEQSGFWFGGIFGIIQAIVWYVYPSSWLLPVCGFLNGYLTNLIALKMIFEPVEPINICGFSYQGLFLKRQKEVAVEYAALVSEKILNAKNIIWAIIRGPSSDKLFKIIHRHVKRAVDDFSGISRPLIQMTIGTDKYLDVKQKVCDRIIDDLPSSMQYIHAYTDRALDVENTIREKLAALPPRDFEGLLHPVFQEEEWKLILVGGVLGALVGVGQVFFIFV